MNNENLMRSDPAVLETRFHPPVDSVVSNIGAVSVQATKTVPAGTNQTRHVVTAFSFRISSIINLAAATIGCAVIDGGSGGTTVLWQEQMSVTTLGASPMEIFRNGLNIAGSVNTALTIEFSGAVTGGFQSVNLSFHDIGGIGQ